MWNAIIRRRCIPCPGRIALGHELRLSCYDISCINNFAIHFEYYLGAITGEGNVPPTTALERLLNLPRGSIPRANSLVFQR